MPGTLSRICEASEERAGERRPPTRFLVLEVDIEALPACGIADAPGPRIEVGFGVVGAPEAQVAEGCGSDHRRLQVVAVRDAEGGAVLGEEGVGRIAEPALVAELERRLEAGREDREEVA